MKTLSLSLCVRSVCLSALLSLSVVAGSTVLSACHAAADDPAGQAGELSDPVRRQNALKNIHDMFTGALRRANGDRTNADVKRVTDATIEKLSQAYIDYPEDSQNGRTIIDLLVEMQDVRGLPALTKALAWRAEVSEEHAIQAARAFPVMDIPDDKKGEVIAALGTNLERVTGARPVDNRMRVEFIRALGAFRDSRALPALTKVVTTQTEAQNFLINRLAGEQIAKLADPESIPTLIQALFLFAPNNPALRMNDVASEGLVRIGRPAFEPLKQVLAGEHAEGRAIAESYLAAVRQRAPEAAEQMSVATIMSGEGTFALGALGFREALEPLLAEAANADFSRRMNGTIALVRLNVEPGDVVRIRDAIKATYLAVPEPQTAVGLGSRAQILAASRNLYDPELLPFYLEQASKTDDPVPDVRFQAVTAYALLTNRAEAAALRAMFAHEPSSTDESSETGGFRETFERDNNPMLAVAQECDQDITCWIGKLGDADEKIARKAAYMIGRYGRDNEAAITALVGKLDSNSLEVRFAALNALDRIATHGSQAAIDKIEQLRQSEEGTSTWNNFRNEALPTQARLRARMSPGS